MNEKDQTSIFNHYTSSWIFTLTVVLSFPAQPSRAMEWQPDAAFGIELEYTDNIFMVDESPTADTYFYGTADFRLGGRSETRSIDLDARARIQRLQRTKSANNEFYSAGLNYSEDFAVGNFGLRADYSEGSTRTTDLETIGVRPSFIFGKRRTTTIRPRIEFQANENNRLAFTGIYDLVRYDLDNLTDYTNYQIGFDWFYALNNTVELDTRLVAQRYDSLDNLIDHDYGSVQEIIDIDASERWHYQIGAGLGYLIRKFDENYRTFLGRFRVTHENDNSQLYFMTETNLQPTATARLSRLSRVSLGYHHVLSETSSMNAEIRASRSNLIDTSPNYDNDVMGFNLGYTANLSERLSWGVRYTFTNNQSSIDNRDRTSNSVFLSLTMGFAE